MMRIERQRLVASGGLGLVAGVIVLGGCTDDLDVIASRLPNDPIESGVQAPTPGGIRAEVGSRRVVLFWDSEGSEVASFRVHRMAGETAEREIARDLGDTTYVDRGLANGTLYRYRVQAVLTNGLAGMRSDPIFVVPDVYGVLIEDGSAFANDTFVSLSMTAPNGTAAMRFGLVPDLSGETWRRFSSFGELDLGSGEGPRTAYAQFQDVGGNETFVVSDDVIVDTRAEILSVTHDGGTAPIPPGTIVRFSVTAGEVNGRARVDIQGGRSDIPLFDDGAHGDGGANDGVYSVDFEIPTGLEVSSAPVVGRFTDPAGNEADSRAAATRITINGPPTAVVLDAPFNVQATSVSLSWSRNLDEDFALYRVLRAPSANVLGDPERMLVAEIEEQTENGTIDTNVDENAVVFYAVEVLDTFGASSTSNVVSTTTPNEPPPAVRLTSEGSTSVSVSMSWEESGAEDFALYRVFRAVESAPGTFSEVAQFSRRSTINYTDFFSAPADSTYYFYKLLVEDTAGASTESNVIDVLVQP